MARDKELNLREIQETSKSILDEMFYKIDKMGFFSGTNAVRLKAIQNGADFVFTKEEIKTAYLQTTKQLKYAYVVAMGILDTFSCVP